MANDNAGGFDLDLTNEQMAEVERLALKCLDSGMSVATVTGIDEEELEALYAVALNFYEQSQYTKAFDLFMHLVMNKHTDGRFWLGLGGTCQRSGNHQAAIHAYTSGALVDMTNPLYAFHACECYIAMKNWDKATEAAVAVETLAELEIDGADHSKLVERANVLKNVIAANARKDT